MVLQLTTVVLTFKYDKGRTKLSLNNWSSSIVLVCVVRAVTFTGVNGNVSISTDKRLLNPSVYTLFLIQAVISSLN